MTEADDNINEVQQPQDDGAGEESPLVSFGGTTVTATKQSSPEKGRQHGHGKADQVRTSLPCPMVDRGRSPLARGHGNPLHQSRAKVNSRGVKRRQLRVRTAAHVTPVHVKRSRTVTLFNRIHSTRTTADGWG